MNEREKQDEYLLLKQNGASHVWRADILVDMKAKRMKSFHIIQQIEKNMI